VKGDLIDLRHSLHFFSVAAADGGNERPQQLLHVLLVAGVALVRSMAEHSPDGRIP